MRDYEVQTKINTDFSSELGNFHYGPSCTTKQLNEADKIVVPDAMLDYLQKFFNGIFDGEPLPRIMEHYVVEWVNGGNLYQMFVQFREDKPDWFLIDLFVGGIYAGKLLYPNVKAEDSERNDEGRFYGMIPFIPSKNVDTSNPRTAQALQTSIIALKDVFTYAVLYMASNMNNPVIQKVEKVKPSKAEKRAMRENKKKKPHASTEERDKIYVPHTKRVFTVSSDAEAVESMRTYVYSRWKVRGYSYLRKDGTKVNVKEHFAHRHLPNQGLEKGGRDYILKPREI